MNMMAVLHKLRIGKSVTVYKTDQMARIVEFTVLHDMVVKVEADREDKDQMTGFKITKI